VTTHAPPFASFTVLNTLQLGLVDAGHDHAVDPVVSDLDLMAGLRPECAGSTAGELAASDVVIADPGDTLEHVAQLMAEHNTAHLVVVSPSTRLPIGILSTLDVARALAAG